MATVVDINVLLQVIGSSFVAGVLVSGVFGLVIYGGTRYADLRREGNTVGAVFFAAFAGLGLAVVAASVVIGIVVMTNKS